MIAQDADMRTTVTGACCACPLALLRFLSYSYTSFGVEIVHLSHWIYHLAAIYFTAGVVSSRLFSPH